ncbi:2-keto-4-pentenoate hydratase/2-oxohepta-3-ene-1,7-dioic acid hydratase in catechol pathway [Antricoccus suffuscus]|uniref:2-keto-4-pentenoate hydratase/2-oxohepta-3-ene-1,7-dioic acid hydratase in catechol pathway n=1 Tax=Antricoccus suffuscus TaxID=1629062 RepID=A0A2T1A424_9ACTN|nr:fumarylacetoacetate hydrolase family protein [Antricoccus suffuscus]PRZ43361.1 2-keto-4-pentenoate hydratase/2-oxohepta-3-ene-1,7-dioic acid hydratase in catechol pathway [Antricoccus suffuscus]
MRFATYESADGRDRVGVLSDNTLHGLDTEKSLVDLLTAGDDALIAAGTDALNPPHETIAWESARIKGLLRPPSMRDSMCFHEHIRNARGSDIDERHSRYPAFYFSNPAGVIGPYDEVAISPGCEQFDYELEIAAVIGTAGSNIRPQDAAAHIAGYTIYCDWSARDIQMDEMVVGLGPAKGKDGATTLGPVLVTADELEPFRKNKGFDLAMTVAINGQPFSAGNWSTIDWSFDDVVAYTSRGTHLVPGDVLGSGTVGRGCLLEHFRMDPDGFRGWLAPGDEVVLEVERIGQLRQKVVAAPERHPLSSGH